MNEEIPQDKELSPKQSTMAIIGGILGLLSLFIGIFAAVPAVILGHIALVQIGQSSGRLTGKGLVIFAFVTGYIAIALFVFARISRN